jgi:hypothetical protein
MPPAETLSAAPLETAQSSIFDHQQVLLRSQRAFAKLERLAENRLRHLKNARTVEDYLTCLLESQEPLIRKLLGQLFTPESIAGTLINELGDIAVSKTRLITAIRQYQPASENDPVRKRIGRPPKSAVAAAKPETAPALGAPQQSITNKTATDQPKKPPSPAAALPKTASNRVNPARGRFPGTFTAASKGAAKAA